MKEKCEWSITDSKRQGTINRRTTDNSDIPSSMTPTVSLLAISKGCAASATGHTSPSIVPNCRWLNCFRNHNLVRICKLPSSYENDRSGKADTDCPDMFHKKMPAKINRLFAYLTFWLLSFLTYFLTHLLPHLERVYSGQSSSFQARGRRRRPNLALVVCVHLVLQYILLPIHVCFSCVWFSFFSTKPSDWLEEKRLWNDLFCAGCETLNQSMNEKTIPTTKIRALPFGTLSQTLNIADFSAYLPRHLDLCKCSHLSSTVASLSHPDSYLCLQHVGRRAYPVSYTHLTLPTIYSV